MRIAIVGGTGRLGSGLARRWLRAGHAVWIGSRDPDKAIRAAARLAEQGRGSVIGGDQGRLPDDARLAVLSVPYAVHAETLASLAPQLHGRTLIDVTVPLVPPNWGEVHLPVGHSAALEAQALLGSSVRVVAALHHVGHAQWADTTTPLDADVLVCSDDEEARTLAIRAIDDLGVRGLDAGPLRNAIALEALTPVLLHMMRRYRVANTGIRVLGLSP